ncbi:MAG: response regulator [Verrucomicrobiia bacterium]
MEDDLKVPLDGSLREREKRITAMNALVNKIAHDFNNLLSPLIGWFSMIRDEAPQNSTISFYTTRGEQIARDFEKKLDEIMNSVRPERRFNPSHIDFKKLLEEEIESWRKSVPDSINLEVYSDIDECVITSDINHWRAAIRNLLNNARYALALGGKLEIKLKKVLISDEEAKRFGVNERDLWLLTVKDNGLGMSPEVLEKALEPFFTTRGKNQSIGLGLTHLYSLARLQGGQVLIESEEGKGTTVYVYFAKEPIKAGSQVADEQKKFAPITVHGKINKILLVDDDPLVLEVLKMFLQRRNYEVLTASNGRTALELFKKKANEISLIITDVRMPEMNGFEFIDNIKKIKPDAPILFISGEKESVLGELVEKYSFKPFKLIKKPCTCTEFLSAIDEVLNSKDEKPSGVSL